MTAAPTAPAIFEDAFDGMFRRAFLVGRRILADTASAEDVAAEATARAYVHWAKIGQQPWREAWVARVATNLALDVARKRTRIPVVAGGTSPACPRALPVARTGTVRNAGGYAIAWSDPVVARLEVRGRTCDDEAVTLELSSPVTLADALAGPFTLTGTGTAGTASLTITATPAG